MCKREHKLVLNLSNGQRKFRRRNIYGLLNCRRQNFALDDRKCVVLFQNLKENLPKDVVFRNDLAHEVSGNFSASSPMNFAIPQHLCRIEPDLHFSFALG
jgi:hypothetical protein